MTGLKRGGAAIVETVTALFKDRPLAPQIAARLDAAVAKQAALERELSAMALAEVMDEAGAAETRQRIERELVGVRDEAARLRAALSQASARDQRTEADAQATKLAGQLAEFKRICGVRHAAMSTICEHLAGATAAYKKYLAATESLALNFPEGTKRPGGSEFALSYATVELASEMWRLADATDIGGRNNALPGAAPPRFDLAYAPDRIAPAHVAVADWNAFLISAVERQVSVINEFAIAQIDQAA